MMAEKITKDMTFKQALDKFPGAGAVMMKYGLHCIGCHIAAVETIEQGCLAHGLKKEDVENMVKEINEAIEKK